MTIATPAPRPGLRYCDYYSYMTLADFTRFQAECEAGTTDPANHGISQGEPKP